LAVGDDPVAASSRAYGRLIEAAARFATNAFQLALRHRDEYLRGLLPFGRVPALPPAPLPAIPQGEDTAGWWAWYQLVAGWVSQEQAWSAAAYRAIAEEAARGQLAPDALEVSARASMERRLHAYMTELSDLYSAFLTDIMDAAGAWLGHPTAQGRVPEATRPVILEVRGVPDSIAMTGLLIENDHRERATITCVTTATGTFTLTASPSELALDAGESARLAVEVGIPGTPGDEPDGRRPAGPLLAGWIAIHGHGEQDLVAEVHAYLDASSPTEEAED
jgi:hypothetical protein